MLPFIVVAIIMIIAVAIPLFNSSDNKMNSALPQILGTAYRIMDYRTNKIVNYVTEEDIEITPNEYDEECLYNFTIKCAIKLNTTEYLEFPIKEKLMVFNVFVDDRPMLIDYITNGYYNIHLTKFGTVKIKRLL